MATFPNDEGADSTRHNTYELNSNVSMFEGLQECQTDTPTITLGDSNTLFSVTDRWNKTKNNKDTFDLNGTISQLGPTEIHKILHPRTAEHTCL